MRKVLGCLLILSVLLCLAPAALAAGSASLSGADTARAGDTITLTFTAGGGILGGSGTVSYDASQLTLQGYSSCLSGSWTVEFNSNNFAFWDDSLSSPISGSKAIFKATFKVNGSVTPGTQINVTVSGIRVSDGQAETSLGSRGHTITILDPLSDNCNLASMTVSNAAISPAFSPATIGYSASVPFEISSLNISAKAEHAGAKVSISNNQLTPGGTTTVKVTVTAENGATKVYSIKVARAQDPNYVPSSNAELSEIIVEGQTLSPAFQADITQYYIWLPYETETVSVSAKVADSRSKLSVGTYEQLTPGKGTEIPLTVTAEDGTQLSYTVTVVRAPAHEDVEDFLNGVPAEPPVTEEPTEPVTESTTEPTEVPDTEPAAQNSQDYSVIAGIVGFVLGAALTALIMTLVRKKKK